MNRFKVLVLCLLAVLGTSVAQAQQLEFLSTQLVPIPEANTMRSSILHGLGIPVSFEPVDVRSVFLQEARRLSEQQNDSLVFGGLLQDFQLLKQNDLLGALDGSSLGATVSGFDPAVLSEARLGTGRLYFIPWMRATYLMVANKKALPYLPEGAELQHLTYEQLLEWAKNMYTATGSEKLGFPAAPTGLMPRFLEGFLYPSFTGKVTQAFDSPGARQMWSYLRTLWSYVSPASFSFSRLDRPLLDGQIWVGWDHTARLVNLFSSAPNQFVAFPAPIGPQGRGYLSVLAGLGVPIGGPSPQERKLIEYLVSPRIQSMTLKLLGFLPAAPVGALRDLPSGLRDLVTTARRQDSGENSLAARLPPVPQDMTREFDLIYMLAFSRIVLRGVSMDSVLKAQDAQLKSLLRESTSPPPTTATERSNQ